MNKNSPCMKVKCGVTNCEFNKELACFADALEVNPIANQKAKVSEETSCTTFIEKN
ncbi:MAG: DUF1540 domain-containing protein [Ignavibacteriales bacterium]